MNLPRRLFLKRGGIALAALVASSLWKPGLLGRMALAAGASGKGASKKILICVFQRGAADGLSMVVPHGDPFYYQHRQEIAIPRPTRYARAGEQPALDLDGFFGLHPALDPLLSLYKAGQLAVIHGCGSPSASRSHFDMQDFMESAAPDDKRVQSGWLNRMLRWPQAATVAAHASPFRAVSMTSVVPRSLQGDADALAIRDLSTFGVNAPAGMGGNPAAGCEGMYDGAVDGVLHGAGKESFDAIALFKKTDPTKYRPARGASYPTNSFGRAMMQVAQLIKANVGLEVAFVEVDGWDTHANQGGSAGQLAGRLHDFAQGIAAIFTDLGDRTADVLLLTMSEFGRAARQNGNRGTDHGHGTCFFVAGGAVRGGGHVLGDWPGLAPERLFEGRDLAVTTDFRDVFAEACVRHFAIPQDRLDQIFPNYLTSPDRFRGFSR